MRVEVVSEDMDVRENGAKVWVVREYFLACPRTKLLKRCLWVGRSCWGNDTKLEFVAKTWAHKKNSCKFS